MDTEQRNNLVTEPTRKTTNPSQLWIGPMTELIKRAHIHMQQRWCHKGGCTTCITCQLIAQHQHHSALWIAPHGTYTREDLEPACATLRLTLDDEQDFFIIIQRADYLTASCYNSLLKSIEEPPRGYHFLLLAENIGNVAQTIRSRCTIHQFHVSYDESCNHALIKFFTEPGYENPTDFLEVLDSTNPDELQTIELVEQLARYWVIRYKEAIKERNVQKSATAQHIIETVYKALENPPMSGSSKLFWKNLFLQIKA
jgi:DNA polymerase-3 subunit delta'